MTTHTVTTQAELDAALAAAAADPTGWHEIDVRSPAGVWLSLVSVPGSATVTASGSATVRAYDSATVTASGSATVTASGSATVTASGSATVRAYGSATVTAYGSATVTAYGSATVTAYGSATVRASKFVAVHVFDKRVTVAGGVLIDVTDLDETDVQQWLDYTGAGTDGEHVVLYKAVDANLNSERGFAYPIGTTVECPDWTDTNDCGGGLHLSPHAYQAHDYFYNATRFLRCLVHRDDLRPIPGGVPKAKARRVTVVEEVAL